MGLTLTAKQAPHLAISGKRRADTSGSDTRRSQLANDVQDWVRRTAEERGWRVERSELELSEEVVGGTYTVPVVTIHAPRRSADFGADCPWDGRSAGAGGSIRLAQPVPGDASAQAARQRQTFGMGGSHRVRAGLAAALESGDFPGIGGRVAQRFVSHLHVQRLVAIREEYLAVQQARPPGVAGHKPEGLCPSGTRVFKS